MYNLRFLVAEADEWTESVARLSLTSRGANADAVQELTRAAEDDLLTAFNAVSVADTTVEEEMEVMESSSAKVTFQAARHVSSILRSDITANSSKKIAINGMNLAPPKITTIFDRHVALRRWSSREPEPTLSLEVQSAHEIQLNRLTYLCLYIAVIHYHLRIDRAVFVVLFTCRSVCCQH